MSRSPYYAFAFILILAACTSTEPGDTVSGTTSATTGTTAVDTTDMITGTTTDAVEPTTSGATTDGPGTSSTSTTTTNTTTTNTTNQMPCRDIDTDVALDDDLWARTPQSMLDEANSAMNNTLTDSNAVQTALSLTFTAPTGKGHISGESCPEEGLSYELRLPIQVSFETADGVFDEVLTGELVDDGSIDMIYALNTLDVLDVIGSFMPSPLLDSMGFAQGDFDSLALGFVMDTSSGEVSLNGNLSRVACMDQPDCFRSFSVASFVREP